MLVSFLVEQPIIRAVFDMLIRGDQDKVLLVGGVVRDFILDSSISKDIDVATNLSPDVVEIRLSQIKGGKVLSNAIEYGSISLFIAGYAITVTTFRKDVKTFGRSAIVEAVDDLEIDAGRRDFTINALYADPSGNVFDFFGGLGDISKKLVRFIGDPRARIKEDYLRILRFFRFSARFTNQYDEGSIKAISSNLEGLQKVSKERITFELKKILTSEFGFEAMRKMLETKVCEAVFGSGFRVNISALEKAHGLFKNEERELSEDPFLILAAATHSDCLDILKTKVCLSKKELSIIDLLQKSGHLLEIRNFDKKTKIALLEAFAEDSRIRKIIFFNSYCGKKIKLAMDGYIKMPFSGMDLLRLCPLMPKKEIKNALAHLRHLWIVNEYRMTYEDLSRCAAEFYQAQIV